VAQLQPQALGSPFVASYDSQGYAGGIQSRLHTGLNSGIRLTLLITFRHEQHRKHPVAFGTVLLCPYSLPGNRAGIVQSA
jgi:hypothetical protein